LCFGHYYFLSGTAFCHSNIVTSYRNLQFHQSSSSAKFWCQLFQVRHHHIKETCILTLYSLRSSNSHFSLNSFTMARFKPLGKKRKCASKTKAPAKQGQDNWCSGCHVLAAAAADAAAAPVAAPTTNAVVPSTASLGTDAPSGISAPSATTATTAVIATTTSSTAGANVPDFAAATCSAAAAVPPPRKGSSKAKKPAKGTAVTSGIAAQSAIAATAVSIATASSTANANHSTPPTADAATAVTKPIHQSFRAAAQTANAVLW
jgi:hypothetical protein